jgi:GT2 family glycosyltransferase
MQENPVNPLISIIIVNFNGLRFLDPCLSSISRQSYKKYEIIFVDNGSSDSSLNFIKEHYPEVITLVSEKNLGFAGGTNAGIHMSKGDFILTLNNDTVLDPFFLEEIQKPMNTYPDVGMCGSKILLPDGRINSTAICIFRSGAAWDRGIGELDIGQYDCLEKIFGPSAGAALYRRTMMDEIGLFDEDFFLFMEDVDLAFRAQLAGWTCMYVPSAKVIHTFGGTTGIGSNLSVYYGSRNLLWYIVKNYPVKILMKSLPWIIGRNCAEIPYYMMKGKGGVILRAKFDSAKGIYRMIKKRKKIIRVIPVDEINTWILPVSLQWNY